MIGSAGFNAILEVKCPCCYTGATKKYPLLQVQKLTATHQHGSPCGVRFEQEHGFFFGAMNLSFAFSVAVLLSTGFILFFGFNNPLFITYLCCIPAVVAFLLPLSFRYFSVLYLFDFGGIDFEASYK